MRKIPTVLVRDPDDRAHVLMEISPGCEWVFTGEGVATRKYDGTCVMFDGDRWWARREVKPGKQPPPDYVTEEVDGTTGKTVGWEPIEQSAFVKFHREALEYMQYGNDGAEKAHEWMPGTYELCGPKINGNPEDCGHHVLMRHADAEEFPTLEHPNDPTTAAWVVSALKWEGIVWHHPDGRMAKLKRRDIKDA